MGNKRRAIWLSRTDPLSDVQLREWSTEARRLASAPTSMNGPNGNNCLRFNTFATISAIPITAPRKNPPYRPVTNSPQPSQPSAS